MQSIDSCAVLCFAATVVVHADWSFTPVCIGTGKDRNSRVSFTIFLGQSRGKQRSESKLAVDCLRTST